MGNTNAMVSGGVNGAKIGAQVGGGYGAIVGAIVGGVAGYFSPDMVKKQRESLDRFNKEVVKYTTQSVFDLQRQRVSERMRTSEALSTYQVNQRTTMSSLRAQYGASDVIGASSSALDQVLDYQTDQAAAQEMFNFDVGIDNFNTSLRTIINNGMGQLSNQVGVSMNPNSGAAALQSATELYNQFKPMMGNSSYTSNLSNLGLSNVQTSGGLQLGSTPQSTGTGSSMMSSGDWSSFSFS